MPRFKKQFASYLAADVSSADIEEIYSSAYAAIREDPSHKASEEDKAKWKAESLKRKVPKLTREQRRANVEEKIKAYKAGKLDLDEDEEDEEEAADEEDDE